MLRKITVLIFVLALLPLVSFAQNKALLKPGGETIYLNSKEDAREVFQVSNSKYHKQVNQIKSLNKVNGLVDTLNNNELGDYTSTFGAFGQDVLAGWFEAPADLNIKSVGFDCGDNPAAVGGELKLYKIGNGWTVEKLKSVTSAKNLGYWIASGNGYNDIAPFEDEATDPKTWVSHNSEGLGNPFVEDIWSDAGTGAPITPEYDGDKTTYQWVSMDLLGFNPELKAGEIFAIVVKNVDQQFDANRWGIMANTVVKYGIFKYYANGRTSGDTSTAGWWKREYLFNIVAEVEITGDTPPAISGVDNLQGTLSTAPIEITATIKDENPGDPSKAGVASAVIQYKVNGAADWSEAAMSVKSGDVYSGSIPGQEAGSTVAYQIKATDVNGNIGISSFVGSYVIFKPSGANTLLVFNGLTGVSGYPQDYYFGVGDFANYSVRDFAHDVWAYGPLSAELVNYYTNIIEICTPSPNDYNDEVIKPWLAASGTHNYLLSGQEFLGSRYNYADKDFAAGDFEYDILGVTHSYNDVSYVASGDQNLPSRIFAQQGSLLSDSVYVHFTAEGPDSLQYHPYYELGTAYANWIDGFDVISGQDVDLLVETRGIGGTADVRQVPAMTHRVLGTGNKVVFMSFDPLSINTTDPYHWFGFESYSFQNNAITWFGVTSDVETKKDGVPSRYELTQNFPNPFNPTTTISFSVPERTNVTLKIYDMLGREVRTLINGTREAGNYDVSFEASDLSTGLYVYSLTAGNFTATKKMMLLK